MCCVQAVVSCALSSVKSLILSYEGTVHNTTVVDFLQLVWKCRKSDTSYQLLYIQQHTITHIWQWRHDVHSCYYWCTVCVCGPVSMMRTHSTWYLSWVRLLLVYCVCVWSILIPRDTVMGQVVTGVLCVCVWSSVYDAYSFHVIPVIGQVVTGVLCVCVVQCLWCILIPRDTCHGTGCCWWLEILSILGWEHSSVSFSGKFCSAASCYALLLISQFLLHQALLIV